VKLIVFGAILVATCTSPTVMAWGQGKPGTNLAVDVTVTSVTLTGDTCRLEYQLYNHPESVEKLFTFTVDAPAPVISISWPEPKTQWDTATIFWDRSVAQWAALRPIKQGQRSPRVWFQAIGLPTIVTATYRGDVLPTLGEDDPESSESTKTAPETSDSIENASSVTYEDPTASLSVHIRTIGIEPFAPPITPQALTMRLHRLTTMACLLRWISDDGVCGNLRGHLSALPYFQPEPIHLAAYLRELNVGHTPHGPISNNAYLLLQPNAAYLMESTRRLRN
jgi:hypothetical protein